MFLKACMLKTVPKSPLAQALSYAIKQEIEVMGIMEAGCMSSTTTLSSGR